MSAPDPDCVGGEDLERLVEMAAALAALLKKHGAQAVLSVFADAVDVAADVNADSEGSYRFYMDAAKQLRRAGDILMVNERGENVVEALESLGETV